ncbi:MAG: metallophosphoesterase family protein [Deltaproteobacteria bacterium]|nr:metallophosphoesterase family protein [Deltaproteobacteria bacterium]
MWWLLACHTVEKLPTDDAIATCGDPVLTPQLGYSTSDREAADADSASFGASPEPYHLRYSWSGNPSTDATILWRTDDDTLASQVQYWKEGGEVQAVAGGSFTFNTGGGRVHEVPLCDLAPATTYTYRAGGEGHWSAEYSFTTAPAAGTDVPVVIAVAGDARDNQATWAVLLDQIETFAPDFLVFSGDAVDFGSNMDEWDAFLDAGVGFMESHAMIMVHGNHEFYAQNYFGLVAQPGDEKTFSLDYGPLHLAVLDDSASSEDRAAQAEWLDADLGATTQTWKVVSHHMPAYSSCNVHGSDTELQELWSPVEEAHGVQLDIVGHNHNYERSVPLRGGVEVAPGEGTVYVVAAGAGADPYDNDMANAFTAVAAVTEHFALLTIDGGQMEVVARDLAGNEIDRFTLSP